MPQNFDFNDLSCNKIHQSFGQGITSMEIYNEKKDFYGFCLKLFYFNLFDLGLNSTEIPNKSIFHLIIEEIFSSYFVLQVGDLKNRLIKIFYSQILGFQLFGMDVGRLPIFLRHYSNYFPNFQHNYPLRNQEKPK